jgi:Protein of unknown function (DUF3431)
MSVSTCCILFGFFNTVCIVCSLFHGERNGTEISKGHREHSKPFMTEVIRRDITCRLRSERKCTLVFSRHSEPDTDLKWMNGINKNIRKIVMNSGKALASDHNFCEHRVWANVGRESFKYLTYILENYHRPENFSPITVFCQSYPLAPRFEISDYLTDVHNLCLRDGKSNMMRWGFLYLGYFNLIFKSGLQTFPNYDYESDFRAIFNTSTTEPINMQFVPQSCFAVSRANILSQPTEFYEKLISAGNLNTLNNPMIGHVYERSWTRIMNSECERKIPWCCHTNCNSPFET